MHACSRVGVVVVALGFIGAVFAGCERDPASVTDAGSSDQQDGGPWVIDSGTSSNPDGGASRVDSGSPATDGGSFDAGTRQDAGLADAGDEPFGCVASAVSGADPSYAVGGALEAFTGGPIAVGTYRAVAGTRKYTEAAPGDCAGITPPAATPYRTELEFRATHYALRILTSATTGSWVTSNNVLKLTQSCPDAKPESGVAYTASGTTIVFQATKQDFVSGGCHWYMVYTLERQL